MKFITNNRTDAWKTDVNLLNYLQQIKFAALSDNEHNTSTMQLKTDRDKIIYRSWTWVLVYAQDWECYGHNN